MLSVVNLAWVDFSGNLFIKIQSKTENWGFLPYIYMYSVLKSDIFVFSCSMKWKLDA